MNDQFYGYMISGILVSGVGMSLCSLIVTIILTSIKRPRLYHLLRFGMTTAGFSLSNPAMSVWIVIVLFSTRLLEPWHVRSLWAGVACFLIPMVMGALAAIGPKYFTVLWMGRIVMYTITPLAAVWILSTPFLDHDKAEFAAWLFLYFVVTAIWWEGLVYWDRKLQKAWQQAWDPSFQDDHSSVNKS